MKKLIIFIIAFLLLFTVTASASEIINADYYFYSRCADCGAEESAEKELRAKLEIEYPNSNININIYNVADETLNQKLKDEFLIRGISEEKLSMYPIVFIGDTVLIGQDYYSAFDPEQKTRSLTELVWTAISGLAGGISPCSLSLILMLLTQLITNKKRALASGLSFITGRGLIYLLLGTALSGILNALNTSIIYDVISAVTVIFCILLAILCFIDFVRIKSGHAGKAILKLPAKTRAFYEKYIQKAVDGRAVLITSFFAGIIVGTGEFLCTGQIFAVTVLHFFDRGIYRLLVFLLYTIAMSIPALAVTLLIYSGKSYLNIATTLSQKEHLVKLTLALLFAVFGVFCIWTIYF